MKHFATGLLVLMGLFASTVQADPGLAYFAMMSKRWPCGDSLRVLNDRPAVAVVWNTFGESTGCLKRYLDLPREKILEIHVVNEVCSKNRRCGAYELLRNRTTSEVTKLLIKRDKRFLSKFKNELFEIKRLLDPYKDTKLNCYISPLLESPQNAKNVSPLFSLIREVIPYCQVVWSPLKAQGIGEADVYEGHSDMPKLPKGRCIVNLDGTDYRRVKVREYLSRYSRCDVQFLWTYSFNLNKSRGRFIDPRKRKHTPTTREFRTLGAYLK